MTDDVTRKSDEYQDRLCEQLLTEKLGNVGPPDLAVDILRRHAELPNSVHKTTHALP